MTNNRYGTESVSIKFDEKIPAQENTKCQILHRMIEDLEKDSSKSSASRLDRHQRVSDVMEKVDTLHSMILGSGKQLQGDEMNGLLRQINSLKEIAANVGADHIAEMSRKGTYRTNHGSV